MTVKLVFIDGEKRTCTLVRAIDVSDYTVAVWFGLGAWKIFPKSDIESFEVQ